MARIAALMGETMKILLGLDGSNEGVETLKFALNLPFVNKEFQAVTVFPWIDTSEITGDEVREQAEQYNRETRKEAELVLDVARDLAKKKGVKLSSAVLSGDPKTVLLEHVKNEGFDLIAVGAKGHNVISRFLLGSVSDYIVKQAESPVLIGRFAADVDFNSMDQLRILVGFDNSSKCKQAVQWLERLSPDSIASITLLACVQYQYFYGISQTVLNPDFWPRIEDHLVQGMEKSKEALLAKLPGVTINTELRKDVNDGADAIIAFAEADKSHMIVVGNKAWNTLDRVLLGSVTTRLSHYTKRPLLVIR